MRRTSFIIFAVGCLCAPIAGVAQQSGGTGNRTEPMVGASAPAPTIEEYIDFAHREIAKAKAEKTISARKAERAERRLSVIEHKIEHLNQEVSEVRHSLH